MVNDNNTEPKEGRGEASETSFLPRWSGRKLQARRRDAAIAVEPDPNLKPPPKELTDADMPSLESLDENSDYSGFFSPKVSEELRRMALRKLFRSPGYNIRDGLDDYDEDFTTFTALGDVITQDLRHRMEVEAKRKEEQQLAETTSSEEASAAAEIERDEPPPDHEADREDDLGNDQEREA